MVERLRTALLPGLAMSRSIGDYISHTVGVSAEPEIKRFNLQPRHKFIVIASDGVASVVVVGVGDSGAAVGM